MSKFMNFNTVVKNAFNNCIYYSQSCNYSSNFNAGR